MLRSSLVATMSLGLLLASARSAGTAPDTVAAAMSPAPVVAVPDAGWDPAIRRGELPNGLVWLVQRNVLPERRLLARVVKRVGSLVEEDAERGLAHFCEHMTFNGSPHFAPGELSRALAGAGVEIGAHVNASTGYDRTTYLLDVPIDDEAGLTLALDVIEDFVRGSTLQPKEIEKERGVVLAELRRRQGLDLRLEEAMARLEYGGSMHERRDPGGSPDVVARASAQDIAAFCRRWARPDVTGVALVGDFDADAVSKMLVARLGAIPEAAGEPPPFVPPVAPAGVVAGVRAEPDLPVTTVRLGWYRLGIPEQPKPLDERRMTRDGSGGWAAEEIALDILQRRLEGAVRREGSPLHSASADYDGLIRHYDRLEVRVRPREGRLLEAVTLAAAVVQGLLRDGACPAELQAALARRRARHDSWIAQQPRRSSQEIVGRLGTAIADHGVAISDAEQARLTTAALASFDPSAVREQFARRVTWGHVSVLAAGPGGLPTPAELKAAVEAGRDRAPAGSPCPQAGSANLVPSPPPPGRVVSRRRLDDLGVDELVLSNGMRVMLKHETYQLDDVVLRGVAPGGFAGRPREQLVAAAVAPGVARSSGTRDHDLGRLQELLAGSSARLSVHFDAFSARLQGSSGRDLEPLAQLIHASLARPSFRPDVLARTASGMAAAQRNAMTDASSRVLRAAQDEMGGRSGFLHPTPEEVERVTLPQVEAAWREGIGSPAGWTLALVGDFDVEAAIPVVERWLASIPGTGLKRRSVDAQLGSLRTTPAGSVRSVRVSASEPDQCFTALLLDLRGERDDAGRRDVDRLRSVLEPRLRARMREDLGETYSVNVGVGELDEHPRLGGLVIFFDSGAEARPKLVAIAREEIERLRREAPTEAEAAAVRAEESADWAMASKTHEEWASALAGRARGGDARDMLTREAEIAAVTPTSLHAAAKRFLGEGLVDVYAAP